jgi:hypothetical protein
VISLTLEEGRKKKLISCHTFFESPLTRSESSPKYEVGCRNESTIPLISQEIELTARYGDQQIFIVFIAPEL